MHSPRPSAAGLSVRAAYGCKGCSERWNTTCEDREGGFVTVAAPLFSMEDFGWEEVALVAVGQRGGASKTVSEIRVEERSGAQP